MEIKALVADSSSKVRKNLTRSLKEIGVRNVVEATDANQAVELMEKGTFDLAFAEFNTQIGAGEELVKTLRKMDAQMPIIVTAPETKKLDDVKKYCPTATTYLTTPFTTDQLKKTVAQYVPTIAG